jgi:hypothetical protein
MLPPWALNTAERRSRLRQRLRSFCAGRMPARVCSLAAADLGRLPANLTAHAPAALAAPRVLAAPLAQPLALWGSGQLPDKLHGLQTLASGVTGLEDVRDGGRRGLDVLGESARVLVSPAETERNRCNQKRAHQGVLYECQQGAFASAPLPQQAGLQRPPGKSPPLLSRLTPRALLAVAVLLARPVAFVGLHTMAFFVRRPLAASSAGFFP